jgi:hypothetical protein
LKKKKMRMILMESQGDQQEMDATSCISWEGWDGVRDVMEGLLYMTILEFSIRPNSLQALMLHEVSSWMIYITSGHEQKILLESFVNEIILCYASQALSAFEEIFERVIKGQDKRSGKQDFYRKFTRAKKAEIALAAAKEYILLMKQGKPSLLPPYMQNTEPVARDGMHEVSGTGGGR